eukprot:TRINITY_DN9097_c0_g1_i1.p1 TRINITY_DN9097_c0_g1~~TRINITY_DN9097_c0_g1_i1.p1  ORF type:complete len:665 (+),score=125.25 TRINITY_DN9097_c0_g1_i1:150-2144(+)
MGLLTLGHPMPWSEAKKHAAHVRKQGLVQLLKVWNRNKGRHNNDFLWGDEVEYMICSFSETDKTVKVSLRAPDVLTALAKLAEEEGGETDWKPEFAMYMLESTPGKPFDSNPLCLVKVEHNMRIRRLQAKKVLRPGEVLCCFASFPLLGTPESTLPPTFPNGPVMHSLFVSDSLIMDHPRFATLAANIRERRGHNVAIEMPVYRDSNTKIPLALPSAAPSSSGVGTEPFDSFNYPISRGDHILMDAMAFGMGCCCLQITFQARDISEARRVYDQFVALAPIMISLTAASPMWRGYIADTDTRWSVISQSVDCRTPQELGKEPLSTERFRIPKSRYDSVSFYLDEKCDQKYNDLDLVFDQEVFEYLQQEGMDASLAKHYAHLYIRDPIVIFHETLNVDNDISTDHFENIQSTNWQTARFKPPPANSQIGWRTEFRPMEVQLTEFENAAFTAFTILLTHVLVTYNLALYMPLSKVDENMKRSQARDAVLNSKFWFRRRILANGRAAPNCDGTMNMDKPNISEADLDICDEMTVNEIMNGRKCSGSVVAFPGLVPILRKYVDSLHVDLHTHRRITSYLDFISARASGSIPTMAAWLRAQIVAHPAYRQDSVVSQEMVFDVYSRCTRIVEGTENAESLLGPFAAVYLQPIDSAAAAYTAPAFSLPAKK